MKVSKVLMIVGPLFLLGLFFFPLWNIRLEAPQYPIPLGMDIWFNKITDEQPNDVKNINLMNHYVGMKEIPEHLPEFDLFPPIVVAMVVIGVLIGLFAKPKWYLAWFVVMSLLGAAGVYDFYLWEYDYGHDLNPKAIMKFTNPDGSIMGFQPPLWGTKHILNFVAYSYPRTGAYLMFAGILSTLAAFFVARREEKSVNS